MDWRLGAMCKFSGGGGNCRMDKFCNRTFASRPAMMGRLVPGAFSMLGISLSTLPGRNFNCHLPEIRYDAIE